MSYILIVGNIGTGKTSLASALAERLGLRHHSEPFETNPFLDAFYREPAVYALRSQLSFLTAHHQQHRALDAASGWAVKDGSIFDSAEIVTRGMHRQGFLSAAEWALYWQLYEALSAACAPPALTVYLHADPQVLLASFAQKLHRNDDAPCGVPNAIVSS